LQVIVDWKSGSWNSTCHENWWT